MDPTTGEGGYGRLRGRTAPLSRTGLDVVSNMCHYWVMKDHRLRIPDDLHNRLREAAQAAHRSVNAQVILYIEQGIIREEQDHDRNDQ